MSTMVNLGIGFQIVFRTDIFRKLTLGAPAQVRIFENMILRMKPCCGAHGEFEYYLKLKTIQLKIYQENNDHGIYNISSLFEVGYRIVPIPR